MSDPPARVKGQNLNWLNELILSVYTPPQKKKKKKNKKTPAQMLKFSFVPNIAKNDHRNNYVITTNGITTFPSFTKLTAMKLV